MENKLYKVTLIYKQKVYLHAPTELHAQQGALYKVDPPPTPEVTVEEVSICHQCWEALDDTHPTDCPSITKPDRS